MYFFYVIVFFKVIASLEARQAAIDINRLQRLPNQARQFYSPSIYNEKRRSIDTDLIRRSNDYDDYSSRLSQPLPLQIRVYPVSTAYQKDALKIHQPREDPRLYYQSDAYLKEINSKNIEHEVAAVYPGREVVRVSQGYSPKFLPRKSRREESRIYPGSDYCMRCPHDRTVVAKAGSDRVLLQVPRLTTCSGHMAPSDVKFVHIYGPKFGTSVPRGSHVIVGRITHRGETVHLCKMQVHVIIQSCPVPEYLRAQCDQNGRLCYFTCKDSRLEMLGQSSSTCSGHLEWETDLTVCRARSWCYTPTPPSNGRLSCKGSPIDGGKGLAEGSKCRIRCAQAWQPNIRGVTVCRRGAWTHDLQCQAKNIFPIVRV